MVAGAGHGGRRPEGYGLGAQARWQAASRLTDSRADWQRPTETRGAPSAPRATGELDWRALAGMHGHWGQLWAWRARGGGGRGRGETSGPGENTCRPGRELLAAVWACGERLRPASGGRLSLLSHVVPRGWANDPGLSHDSHADMLGHNVNITITTPQCLHPEQR